MYIQLSNVHLTAHLSTCPRLTALLCYLSHIEFEFEVIQSGDDAVRSVYPDSQPNKEIHDETNEGEEINHGQRRAPIRTQQMRR